MAKYYVRSGEIREVLVAADSESAAFEALDRFFEGELWIFSCPELSDVERRAHLAVEALHRLDCQVVVSQRGFRRGEGAEIDRSGTERDPVVYSLADLLDTYFRLQKALHRLHGQWASEPSRLAELQPQT